MLPNYQARSPFVLKHTTSIYMYVCMDVRKAFLYFDPRIFVLVRLSTPSQTSLNRILCLLISTRITLEIELFTFLNSFAGAVKTWKLNYNHYLAKEYHKVNSGMRKFKNWTLFSVASVLEVKIIHIKIV